MLFSNSEAIYGIQHEQLKALAAPVHNIPRQQ